MFGLNQQQEEKLREIVPDLDNLLSEGKKREILLIIDDAILDTFDENQEPTKGTIEIQRIYDHVYTGE